MSSPSLPVIDTECRAEAQDHRFITLDFYRLFWIFTLASVFGLIIETLVSFPIDGMWKNRAGLIWGPFSPIYGVGAVLITVLLNGMRDKPWWKLFLFAALIGGTFELVAGWFWETCFGIVAWSYIDQPFNIAGHTCLGIALCWGAIGLLWMKVLLPWIVGLIEKVPPSMRTGITTLAAAFMIADVAVTVVGFDCWFKRQSGIVPQGAVQQLFATWFGDDFMSSHFQTMSLWSSLAGR